MRPFQIFTFLLTVGVLCLLCMLYFPEEGIKLNDNFTLTFASLDDFNDDDEGIKDVEAFLQEYEIAIDSTAIYDSIERARIAYRKEMLRIQWPDSSNGNFEKFVQSLEDLKTGKKKKVRVMHYGDSQIEGDRITTFIRDDLQKAYGGIGPGLIPAVMAVPSSAINQDYSENWNRFTLFGRRDTNVQHRRYVPLGAFAMYDYPFLDTVPKADSSRLEAFLNFSQSGMAKYKARKYNSLRMFYGHADSTAMVRVLVKDSLLDERKLVASDRMQVEEWKFNDSPKEIQFEFSSVESPEFYAFSFEGDRGVVVDNIAMRGSSGTLFKKMDGTQFRSFIRNEEVGLFILQYGGNSVPYVKDAEQAERYGRWFSSQIQYLQKIKPNAAFIVIGPSDMSTKVGAKFVSYPFLVEVRDALKKAALDNGAGFWDLYEVMGGRNSMISWVESDPPLAGADYVHFTYSGTKRVSELFLKALWQDINKINGNEELVE